MRIQLSAICKCDVNSFVRLIRIKVLSKKLYIEKGMAEIE